MADHPAIDGNESAGPIARSSGRYGANERLLRAWPRPISELVHATMRASDARRRCSLIIGGNIGWQSRWRGFSIPTARACTRTMDVSYQISSYRHFVARISLSMAMVGRPGFLLCRRSRHSTLANRSTSSPLHCRLSIVTSNDGCFKLLVIFCILRRAAYRFSCEPVTEGIAAGTPCAFFRNRTGAFASIATTSLPEGKHCYRSAHSKLRKSMATPGRTRSNLHRAEEFLDRGRRGKAKVLRKNPIISQYSSSLRTSPL
jgi:hypothetical protein